jgi:hypothetical protein
MTKGEPVRIQLKRDANFDLQAVSRSINGRKAEKVDRTTPWGNPFRMEFCPPTDMHPEAVWMVHTPTNMLFFKTADGAAFAAQEHFREWINAPEQEKQRQRARQVLRGKNLACWCAKEPCHASVLLEVVNERVRLIPVERIANKVGCDVVTVSDDGEEHLAGGMFLDVEKVEDGTAPKGLSSDGR